MLARHTTSTKADQYTSISRVRSPNLWYFLVVEAKHPASLICTSPLPSTLWCTDSWLVYAHLSYRLLDCDMYSHVTPLSLLYAQYNVNNSITWPNSMPGVHVQSQKILILWIRCLTQGCVQGKVMDARQWWIQWSNIHLNIVSQQHDIMQILETNTDTHSRRLVSFPASKKSKFNVNLSKKTTILVRHPQYWLWAPYPRIPFWTSYLGVASKMEWTPLPI